MVHISSGILLNCTPIHKSELIEEPFHLPFTHTQLKGWKKWKKSTNQTKICMTGRQKWYLNIKELDQYNKILQLPCVHLQMSNSLQTALGVTAFCVAFVTGVEFAAATAAALLTVAVARLTAAAAVCLTADWAGRRLLGRVLLDRVTKVRCKEGLTDSCRGFFNGGIEGLDLTGGRLNQNTKHNLF